MKIAVITNEALKEEWLAQGLANDVQVEWLTEIMAVPGIDCYIDLAFKTDTGRIAELNK